LVPNSFFLENKIINWTHSGKLVRTCISVGVAYNSPERDVERLMLRAAQEHSKIHKKPKPFVLFKDFGDNSLKFELYYWLTIQEMMELLKVASDVRFDIKARFRQEHIVIAFPQRDVHLDTQAPFEVKIIEAPEDPSKKK
jgi:potassium efflux system protein